jgi:hypothetical protein
LFLLDECRAEEPLPFRDQVPGVAIGDARFLRRLGELRRRLELVEDGDQLEVEFELGPGAKAPDRPDVDADHHRIIAPA